MVQDYQYTTTSPAYVWDYRNIDGYNNRKQTSSNIKLAYRLNEHTDFYINTIVNDAFEPYNDIYTSRAYSGRTVGSSGSSAILPTYTDLVTEVRPVSSANFQLNSTRYSFTTRERLLNIGGKSDFDRWKFDYDLSYNYSHPNIGDGRNSDTSGGIFTMNITNLGWVLDKSKSQLYPSFTQTSGSPIDKIASYKSGLLTTRDGTKRNTDIFNASSNASYILPFSFKSQIKTGVRFRHEKFDVTGANRRWNYLGSSLADLVDPSIVTSSEQYYGVDLPYVSSVKAAQSVRNDPRLWNEDLYYAASSYLQNTSSVDEDVSAGYIQSQSSFGRLGVLGGVRFERTDVRSFGYLASKTLSTSAQQNADPLGSAYADYNHPQTLQGHYQDFFPGMHFTYKIMRNFMARASFSQGIGRPAASNLTPSLSSSDSAQTVTINNPGLKPQYSKNYDLSLEYYFEPVGQFSVGYFRKKLTDFITSATVGTVGSGTDNGYNGDYAGYSIISNINGGSATINGWEISYTQQFAFLPGFLKGIGVFANYTKLKTEGDYGDSVNHPTNQLAGFIPETANGGLTFKYRRFGSRAMLNYTGDYLNNYSSSDYRLQYRAARTTVNLGFSYELSRYCTLSCDIANLFNEPQILYRYSKDRTSAATWNFTSITFGVSGRF
jgi:TonB-dependent receptor